MISYYFMCFKHHGKLRYIGIVIYLFIVITITLKQRRVYRIDCNINDVGDGGGDDDDNNDDDYNNNNNNNNNNHSLILIITAAFP